MIIASVLTPAVIDDITGMIYFLVKSTIFMNQFLLTYLTISPVIYSAAFSITSPAKSSASNVNFSVANSDYNVVIAAVLAAMAVV